MPISQRETLKISWFDTSRGRMVALADGKMLYFLAFADQPGLDAEIERFALKNRVTVIPGRTGITELIITELAQYFSGMLTAFKTPCSFSGTTFQKIVWQELQKIPYGTTCSYADLARAIGQPKAFRAVAQANGANPLALIVPCHRVVYANGALGGYAGGVAHKQWLIDREKTRADL